MPSPIEKLFENATQLPGDQLPLKLSKADQPSTVSGVGEVKDDAGSPAEYRQHDTEMAHILGEDLRDEEPSPPLTFFPVRVTQSGGSAGDASTKASFTYIVKDLFGEVLDNTDTTPIQPESQRPIGRQIAPSISPTDGGDPYGSAFWDENHILHLLEVFEVDTTAVCT